MHPVAADPFTNRASAIIMSYYDSIGLLALCDAIDATDAIHYKPAAPPKLPEADPNSGRLAMPLPGPYPSLSVPPKQTYPQHPYLTHVPAAHTVTPSGAMSYAQSQRTAFQQFSSSQRAPDGLPPTLSSQRGGQAPGTILGRGEPVGPYGQGYQNGPPGPQQRPLPGPPLQRPPQPLPPRAAPTTQSPAPQAPLPPGQYRTEICPICQRTFKGPKASTHKQQHIRRLHPDDYMPKRGGKKRVLIPPM